MQLMDKVGGFVSFRHLASRILHAEAADERKNTGLRFCIAISQFFLVVVFLWPFWCPCFLLP